MSLFPQVHFFNSFFYDKLRTKGYDGVKRWTKNVSVVVAVLPVPVALGKASPPCPLMGQSRASDPSSDPFLFQRTLSSFWPLGR